MAWISAQEAGRRLEKSSKTVRRACESGSLGLVCRRNGREWEIEEDSIAVSRAGQIAPALVVSGTAQQDSEPKTEYERRIKKEDWIKKQRENKIKAGEYAKISTAVAISCDYIDFFYSSLRERIDKLVLSQQLTQDKADLVWQELVKSSEDAKNTLRGKIENAHL